MGCTTDPARYNISFWTDKTGPSKKKCELYYSSSQLELSASCRVHPYLAVERRPGSTAPLPDPWETHGSSHPPPSLQLLEDLRETADPVIQQEGVAPQPVPVHPVRYPVEGAYRSLYLGRVGYPHV